MDRRWCFGLIIAGLLFPSVVIARMNVMMVGGGATAGGAAPGGCAAGCNVGTYSFYWDGDHTTAEDYACYNDCANNLDANSSDGTDRIVTTSYGGNVSGKFFKDANTPTAPAVAPNATNQYVYWREAADVLCDDSEGTIWLSVIKPITDDDTMLIEINANPYSSTNRIHMYYRTNNQLRGYHNGNSNPQFVNSATCDVQDGIWQRVAYTWKVAASEHCTKVVHKSCSVTTATNCDQDSDCPGGETCSTSNDSGWCCEADAITAFLAGATQPVDVVIGGFSQDESVETDLTTYIDKVFIISGAGTYKTADPSP